MNKKIVLLSRISTNQQNLESQTNDLIKEAKRLGYSTSNQILIESVESAIKLSEAERIGIQQLKQAIETDPSIDCVMCWEPSRLSRQQKMLYSIRDYLVERKIQLIILNPYVKLLTDDRTNIDTTASIVFSLFATISENEMSLKKQRFMRAKNELTQQGKKSAGAVIFGYMKDSDKRCVPHPIYSKIIIDAFNHYLEEECSSVYECYKYICSRYPEVFEIKNYTRSHRKMMALLNNKTYTGNWCYPPLISEDIFDKAREKMSKAKCHPRYANKHEVLGRGKVYCGYCGHMLTGVGGQVKAYNCSFKDGKHNMTVSVKIVDDLIWEETRVLANINASLNNNTRIAELNKEIESKQNVLNQYKKLKEESEQKLNRLLDLYINGRINSDILSSKQSELNLEDEKIKNNITLLNVEIASLQDILEKSQKDLLNYKPLNFDSIESFEAKQELVRKYINKVIINKIERGTYDIKFEYNSGIFIIQQGHYIYEGKNQCQKVYRINADDTTDRLR